MLQAVCWVGLLNGLLQMAHPTGRSLHNRRRISFRKRRCVSSSDVGRAQVERAFFQSSKPTTTCWSIQWHMKVSSNHPTLSIPAPHQINKSHPQCSGVTTNFRRDGFSLLDRITSGRTVSMRSSAINLLGLEMNLSQKSIFHLGARTSMMLSSRSSRRNRMLY